MKKSLGTYSVDCVKAVTKSFEQVELLLKHMIGQKSLDEKFKYELKMCIHFSNVYLNTVNLYNFRTCTPIEDSIENKLDMSNFFENLAGYFAGVVQYNKDNSPHATVTIDDVMLRKCFQFPITSFTFCPIGM